MTSPASPPSAEETFTRLALRVLQGDGLTADERRVAAGAISNYGKSALSEPVAHEKA